MSSLVVRIKENSWIARLAAFKLGTENVAIVTGNTIHLWNCSRHHFLQNPKWLRHELCHVEQYQRFGFFPFIARYLWESMRNGYYNNRFEREARDSENTKMPDAKFL